MREEARKLLDRVRRRGIYPWLPTLAVVALVCGGVLAFHVTSRDENRVWGTVQSADWRLNSDTAQQYPFIEVKLDSGSSVRVGSVVGPALPIVGDRITLRQRALLFDYLATYEWDGPAPLPPAAAPVPTPVSLP